MDNFEDGLTSADWINIVYQDSIEDMNLDYWPSRDDALDSTPLVLNYDEVVPELSLGVMVDAPHGVDGAEELTFLEMAQLYTYLGVMSPLMENLVSGQVRSPVSSPQVILKVYNNVDGVESPCPNELYNAIWDPVHNGAIFVDFAFQVPKACYIVEFQVQGLSFQASDKLELLISTPGEKQYIPCHPIAFCDGQCTIRSNEIPMRDPKKNRCGNVVRKADPPLVAKGVGFLKLIRHTQSGPQVIARKTICIRSQQSSRRNR